MQIDKLFRCLVKSYTCRSDKDNNPIYLDVLKHNASSLVFPVVQIWCHVYFIIENKILATYVHNGHCIVIWLPFVDLILRVFSNPTNVLFSSKLQYWYVLIPFFLFIYLQIATTGPSQNIFFSKTCFCIFSNVFASERACNLNPEMQGIPLGSPGFRVFTLNPETCEPNQ